MMVVITTAETYDGESVTAGVQLTDSAGKELTHKKPTVLS